MIYKKELLKNIFLLLMYLSNTLIFYLILSKGFIKTIFFNYGFNTLFGVLKFDNKALPIPHGILLLTLSDIGLSGLFDIV